MAKKKEVVEKKVTPKAVKEPKAKKSVTEVTVKAPVVEVAPVAPVSEWFDYNGVVGKPNADGTVTLYKREHSVQVTEVVEAREGMPITKLEAYQRVF